MAERFKGVPPLVMTLQPTEFEVMREPEELRRWEDILAKRFGIRDIEALGKSSHSKTICSCGDAGLDDTDMDDPF